MPSPRREVLEFYRTAVIKIYFGSTFHLDQSCFKAANYRQFNCNRDTGLTSTALDFRLFAEAQLLALRCA
jgi:hypothetical protein